MRKSHEDVPLEPTGDGSKDTYVVNQVPKGMFLLSKLKLILVAVLILLLFLIIIIVLAVLLGKETAENQELKGSDDDSKGFVEQEGDKQPTTPSATKPPPPTLPPGPWDNIRLPRSITPSHYELHLDVDPNKDGFSGHETITVDVTKETSQILIHSNGLNITEAAVLKPNSEAAATIKKQFNPEKNNFHVIETATPLSKGKYLLTFKFRRLYRTDLFGLSKGVYRQNDGQMATFLTTQLEPLFARTMFPCFDEPALKATFNISLAYPKDMVGLSNGEVEKQQDKDQTRLTYYKTTPKMSTYLVSVVVGHFESKHLIIPSGVKLNAFAQPGNTDQMDFALRLGKETLEQMEQTFGIKYPLPKLDLVATPACAIAMENWGSIRFREDYLLYKKDFSPDGDVNELLLRLVPHEIIHMWFGNYATMEWWDDIWLNEAVTDFYTYFDAAPKSLAAWKRNVQFIPACHAYALEIDGYVNTRPVIQPTTTPTLGETFDRIVYKKGSALLNMAKYFYPKKENYNKGMKKYLNKFPYGNAVGNDMWDALQSTCVVKECPNFKGAMDTWMKKKNYPVLTVKKTGNGKYTVQQERFVYDKTAKLDKLLWSLQFTCFCSNATKTQSTPPSSYQKWMHKETLDIQCGGDGWIKGNLGQIGFYRVNYDDVTWGRLAEQLNYWPSVFSAADRYGLIDDAFNLVRGERLDIKTALNITNYLRYTNEMDYFPWLAVQTNAGYILSILPDHSHTSHHLKRYLAYQSGKVVEKLGYKDTGSPLEKLLRMIVVGFQCDAGSRSCLGNMTSMFRQWKQNPLTTSITPALRKFVYFYGVRLGVPEDWDLVLEQLQKNTIASEFLPLLMGLAGTRDRWVLYKYLKLMRNATTVQKQYFKYVIDNVANHNPDGSDVTWAFLHMNWQEIKQKDSLAAMMTYLPTITKRFSTTNQLTLLEKFINENLNGEPMPRALRKTVEIVRLNIAWRKAHESDLEEWLKAFLKSKSLPEGNSQSGFAEPA